VLEDLQRIAKIPHILEGYAIAAKVQAVRFDGIAATSTQQKYFDGGRGLKLTRTHARSEAMRVSKELPLFCVAATLIRPRLREG
jgi:hypothetical protein